MNISAIYELFLQNASVVTDTRKLNQGDIFFALKGPNFNGNQYALQALKKGAAYCICDEDLHPPHQQIILVADVLQCLQQLALHHRRQFNIPFLAITGSNGKTTTKELIYAVLSTTLKTYTTVGNLNNHIGIPLTILSIKKNAEIAVIEMGANHQREIEGYCKIALPTHGLINNCGKAHLEGFGGVEGVKKGKGELYDFIRNNNGTIFINNDFDYLQEMSAGINNRISYGTNNADITGQAVNGDNYLAVSINNIPALSSLHTHLVGLYNVPNILAAVCVGQHFKVAATDIKKALENYEPTNSRSQLINIGTNEIILDAYNANPTSMKAAIENFAGMNGSNKVLILGAMKELGDCTAEEHAAIVRLIDHYNWHRVVLVGGDYPVSKDYLYFDDSMRAKEWFDSQHFKDTSILVKGSRSMQMEKVIE